MASKSFSKALRAPLMRQSIAPTVQRRTFVAALAAASTRPVAAAPAMAKGGYGKQVRGVKTIDFAGHKEDVYGKLPNLFLTVSLERP